MALRDKAVFLSGKIAEWSLYIMVLTIPFAKSIIEITITTALVAFVANKLLKKEPMLGKSAIDILLYAVVGASLISILNTPHEYMVLSARALFSKSIKFALLFLISRAVIDTRQKLNNFVIMAAISCFIILLDGFTQHYITNTDFLHNYVSFKYLPLFPYNATFPTASFPFPNDFAAWILIFIFPSATFLFWKKGSLPVKFLACTAFSGLLYMLILTKARGAWLGFLLSVVLLSFVKIKKIGILILAAFLLFALFINRSLLSDIFSMTSIDDRGVMWQNSWKIFKEHPVIGNGLNTFFVKYAAVRDDKFKGKKGSYAHNCYLQMAADTGLLGLGLFLAFVTAVITRGLRSLKSMRCGFYYVLALGISLGLVAFLAHSAVDTNLYSLNLAALFWLFSGILLAVVKLGEEKI